MRTITIEGLRVLAQVGVLAHEFGAPRAPAPALDDPRVLRRRACA